MQVLLVLWLLMAGMKDSTWDGNLERDASVPTGTNEVVAAEGPVNPPPKP
jgi:hypothetical protein